MSFFNRLKPEDFDVLGIGTFSFLFGYAAYELWTDTVPAPFFVVALLVIAMLGLVIDGRIVWHYLIKRDEGRSDDR